MPDSLRILRWWCVNGVKCKPKLASLVYYPSFHLVIDAFVFELQRCGQDLLQLEFLLRTIPNLKWQTRIKN